MTFGIRPSARKVFEPLNMVLDWGRFLQVGLRVAALEIDDLRRRVATLRSEFLKTGIVALEKDCNVMSVVSPADRGTGATDRIDA